MALLPVYNYFIFNGTLTPVDKFIPSENEGGIYEVLRVVDGIPLFLEEHLNRLYHSAKISGKTIPASFSDIQTFLNQLIQKNGVREGNVLISCKNTLKAFFIPHNYPSIKQYTEGVRCGILHAERMNPNAKVFQTTVRKQANKLIAQKAFYEVLLVDSNNHITEGSRSNVFFIKDKRIITPKAEKVLPGITRQKTIECASELGFSFVEKELALTELPKFEAAFLTGTSPNILPVRCIEENEFSVTNEVLRKLMKQFDCMTKEYIKNAQH